jgi:copper oxidase (laccase) domain-containing protein
VQQAWQERVGTEAGTALELHNGHVHFSLRTANALLLERAGVRADRVETSSICTRCQGEAWFSHRGQGAETGRFGAMIAISGKAHR